MERALEYRVVEPACSQVGRTTQKTANSLAALCFFCGIAFVPFASSAEERFAGFFFAVVLAIGSYMGGYILRQILELSGKLCETIRVRCVRLLASLANEVLGRRVRTLENCLVEQSRLLKHVRGELEIALNAEADLRSAIIEIDGRANAATQNLIAEKAQLQAALDRANGERARLTHELADPKRRKAEEPGRPSGSTMRRCPSAPTTSPLKGSGERHMADCREEQIDHEVSLRRRVP